MSSIKHNVADVVWKSPGGLMEVVSMRYEHRMSELPLLRVELKTEDHSLKPDAIVNQSAHVDLMCGDELSQPRSFKGIVTRFAQKRTAYGNIGAAMPKRVFYEADVRPKFWLATKHVDTRVFRQMTIKDIADQILGELGIPCEWKLEGEHITRDHTVQYQESDYHFISRLMEDEGVYFYFDYTLETVIFGDAKGVHTPCEPTAQLDYSEEQTRHVAFGTFERILDVAYEETIGSGLFTVDHYNYETSQVSIKKDDTEGSSPNFPALEQYTHTMNYLDAGRGTFYARTRKEAETASIKIIKGKSTGRSLHVGFLLTMAKHFHDALNKTWLLTAVRMEVIEGKAVSWFEGFESDKPYRAPCKTPRPQVFGVQTAVVTGPSGSKVYLDSLGRCKLQFHWDRVGQKDDQSSMWVRVSNNYAGKDYGIQWIPRVGHEVLVSFIDGNPDLPIVTGRVYNDLNKPPLGPGQKFQNIIKTIKDNHMLFDDSDGAELIEIRAEKDMSTIVVNDERYQIGHDKSINVGNDHVEQIGRNMTLTVGKTSRRPWPNTTTKPLERTEAPVSAKYTTTWWERMWCLPLDETCERMWVETIPRLYRVLMTWWSQKRARKTLARI